MAHFELNGQWMLTSPQRPNLEIPMFIPGDNVSALLQAEQIPDPYLPIMKTKFDGLKSVSGISHVSLTSTRLRCLPSKFG